MASGYSKKLGGVVLLLLCACASAFTQNQVQVTPLTHDIKDLSQRSSKVYDQNGERCALIRFETPIPSFFSFNLGAQQIEKRENKDDEVWIWVSADVKKMTIRCSECTPMKDYRVALKPGNVYRAKITTGLPQEVATTQNINIYCERAPFTISIDGQEPIVNASHNYYTELPIGAHQLMVSAKLYKPYSATFRVFRSRPYMDTIRLEDNYGELQIGASQSSYTLYVDDELQKANRLVKVEPGMHKVVVSKDRYETFETTVEVKLKEKTPVYATLKPAFSVYTITAAEEETEIWVDNQYKGRERASLELVWGKHVIEGRRQGYDTYEFPTKDFTAATEKNIKIPKLNKQYGGIRLSVYPQDAMVFVDGKQVSTSGGVYTDPRVPTGTHFVQARMTDYRSIRDSIVVVSGQLAARDYELEAIALGVATINTDNEIGIYRIDPEGEPIFLGHTTFTGKIPAGENIIELRNTAGVACQYRLFINDKQTHEPVTMPFVRKLMLRTNITGGDIQLGNSKVLPYRVKANKKMKINPMKYEVTINKRGYQTYKDTIDMTQPGTNLSIYRANLLKIGDTISRKRYQSPAFLQRFYDNAGTWFIGVIDFGYTFDFNGGKGFRHLINFGVLPFRYRMLGINPADFELSFNDSSLLSSFSYRPKISLVVPCSRGFAFTFYGGASVNLYDQMHKNELTTYQNKVRMYAIGGASMRFNYAGRFPMDIFAEYKWPIKGVDPATVGAKEQLFRVGVTFTPGVDH
jgi:hypothetical protein